MRSPLVVSLKGLYLPDKTPKDRGGGCQGTPAPAGTCFVNNARVGRSAVMAVCPRTAILHFCGECTETCKREPQTVGSQKFMISVRVHIFLRFGSASTHSMQFALLPALPQFALSAEVHPSGVGGRGGGAGGAGGLGFGKGLQPVGGIKTFGSSIPATASSTDRTGSDGKCGDDVPRWSARAA